MRNTCGHDGNGAGAGGDLGAVLHPKPTIGEVGKPVLGVRRLAVRVKARHLLVHDEDSAVICKMS